MKAILVIDMPINKCKSCMFDRYGCSCLIKANMTDIEKMNDANFCPLKPMPEKIEINLKEDEVERVFKKYYWEKDKFGILNFKKSIKYAFISGYKRCIEELILGEEK